MKKMLLKMSQNLQENTYARALFSFGLTSVISKVSFVYFGHVFVFRKRYGITIVVVRILEMPYPANKYFLKVSNRNPKTR